LCYPRPRGEEIWPFPLRFFRSLAVLSNEFVDLLLISSFVLLDFIFRALCRALDMGRIFPISLWFIQPLH
jgi:hypothetical protein